MPEKIVHVRRRRRIQSFPNVEPFAAFRLHVSPARLAILIAVTAVAFVLAVIVLSYSLKVYNSWREARLLKHATTLLEQNNFNAASSAAREVLKLHPDSLTAFYLLAEATEKQNLEETVSWRAQIARLLPHNIDSQLNLASAALRFGQLDLARKALENVSSDQRDQAPYHVVAGWLAYAEGNFAEQERQFATAVKEEPNNDLYQFNLAMMQIRSSDVEKNAKARTILERLSQIQPFHSGALRALLNDAIDRNELETASRLAQDLQMSQQVTFADYLLCLNLYLKLDEKKFDALLDKVKPVAARDPSDLALLMDWMNNNGLATEVLKWIDKLPSDLTAKPPPAIAIAEAFSEVRNWSRLRRWTRNGSWGDAEYVRLAYQAYGARQSRQSSAGAEFDSIWRAAARATNEQPDRELKLARLATKWNLLTQAEQLWSLLSRNPPKRREALDALYRLYRANNDLKKLYDVLQRLHDSSPDEPAITANLARLGLNIDQDTKRAQELAKSAYDQAPGDVNCAVTYAFSLYGLGRTTQGLDMIRNLPPEKLHDPHAAVYVAVLLLDDNQLEPAKEYIEAAQHGPIYVEEKRLLEDAMAKVAGAPPTPAPSPSAAITPTPTPSPSPVRTYSGIDRELQAFVSNADLLSGALRALHLLPRQS